MNILEHPSGRCDFRKTIPAELRPFCNGKTVYKVSIGHKGAPDFHTRLEAAQRGCDQLFERARRQLEGAFDALDAPRIAYLAEVFYAQEMEADQTARLAPDERELFASVRAELAASGAGTLNWQREPKRRWAEKTRETTEAMLYVYRDFRAIGDVDGLVELWLDEASLLAEAQGLVIDPNDTHGLQELCLALNNTAITVCEGKLKRLAGDDLPTPPEPVPHSKARTISHPTSALSLRELYDGYAVRRKPAGRVEGRSYIENLISFVGHDDATRITFDDIMDWRDILLSEPNDRGNLRDPTTVRDKYITTVRAMSTPWCLNGCRHGVPGDGVNATRQ